MISNQTRQLIRKIKEKHKDQWTGEPSFKSDDAIIEFAVIKLYERLK
jgi:hypothetical protein